MFNRRSNMIHENKNQLYRLFANHEMPVAIAAIDDDDDYYYDDYDILQARIFDVTDSRHRRYGRVRCWAYFVNAIQSVFEDEGIIVTDDRFPASTLLFLYFVAVNNNRNAAVRGTLERETLVRTLLRDVRCDCATSRRIRETLSHYTTVNWLKESTGVTLDVAWFDDILRNSTIDGPEYLTFADWLCDVHRESSGFITVRDMRSLFDYFLNLYL